MNSPTSVEITLRIRLKTPLSVGAAGSRGGLADKAIMRDGWNRPLIPGSQVKGRIRHACEQVARAIGCSICRAPVADTMCPNSPERIERSATEDKHRTRARQKETKASQCVVCALFGSTTYPSILMFGDALLRSEDAALATSERLRIGVGLDRRRRVALEQVLYTTEVTRSGIEFVSSIFGQWQNTEEKKVKALMGLLVAGIQLTTRWGGGSSRGLGWADVTPHVVMNGEEQNIEALLKGMADLCTTAY